MTGIFDRVVCGVDNSDGGQLAARVAARVAAPDGALTLVSADDSAIAVHAGWRMAPVAEELLAEAERALERGRAQAETLHGVEGRLLEGDPRLVLMAEIGHRDASLVVVGMSIHSRGLGIALGSVPTHLLHEAPCSVLVARPPRDPERWPRSIVVGVDGSPASERALAAARELAERLGARLRVVVGTDDGNLDLETARRLAPELEELPGRGVDELVVLSEFNDLVVVGSRGLKGVRALGSVSERVAHQARSAVLVVRDEEREETHHEGA